MIGTAGKTSDSFVSQTSHLRLVTASEGSSIVELGNAIHFIRNSWRSSCQTREKTDNRVLLAFTNWHKQLH